MILYLIKNYIKLMSRSITNILLFIISPLILIAILSSAFHDLMAKYDDAKMYAGYRIENDSISDEMIEAFKKKAENQGMVLTEYKTGDPEDILKDEEIGAFVVFDEKDYTIYQSENNKQEGRILEYAVGSYYQNMAVAFSGSGLESGDLKVEHPDYMEAIDSTDYYGIIEIVYFGWCAIVCGAAIFTSEKKYKIGKKLQVSNLSQFQLYMAKFIPMIVVVGIGTVVSAIISVILFGVKWGNPLLSCLILIASVSAAVAFGLMFYSIFNNLVITIIGVFSAVWFAGFFGGSFETYMFSSHANVLKYLSPIYHVNRSLVELSCMGHSSYVMSAFLYCGFIVIVCSMISILAAAMRKRGRA